MRGGVAWNDSQTVAVNSVGDWYAGKAAPKFYNRRADGSQGSNSTHPDTDFPMFRLSEAYLIYAEAAARGGGGNAGAALGYVNDIRTRAGLAPYGSLEVDSILAERGRELRWEAKRRTDLVRFGRFTGGAYRVAEFLLGGRETVPCRDDAAEGRGVARRVGRGLEVVQAGAVVVGLQVCHVVHLVSGSRRTWAGVGRRG